MDCGGCGRAMRASAMMCRECGWKRPREGEIAKEALAAPPPQVAPVSEPAPPPRSLTAAVATASSISAASTYARPQPDAVVSDADYVAPTLTVSDVDSAATASSLSRGSNANKWVFGAIGGVLVAVAIGYFIYAKHESDKQAEMERVRLEDLAHEARQEAEKTKLEGAKRERELATQVALERQRTAKALEANKATAVTVATPTNGGAAPVPDIRVGESWTYQTLDSASGRKLAQFTYEVLGVNSQEIEIRSASSTDFINGRPFRFTREWNPVTFPQPNGAYREYSKPLLTFSFPLSVGKTWQSEAMATNSVTKNQVLMKISGRVEGTEEILTPAGRFLTYKVVVDQSSEPIAQKASPARVREVNWYSPAIGRNVRQERSTTLLESNKTERLTTELLNHNRK